MLFSKILIVLFSIKTCIGIVPRIFGGNEVSLEKKGNYIMKIKKWKISKKWAVKSQSDALQIWLNNFSFYIF